MVEETVRRAPFVAPGEPARERHVHAEAPRFVDDPRAPVQREDVGGASSVVSIREAGRDPDDILRAALDRGQRISRFEIADPSLEAVFIEHVGRPPAEEQHLALPDTGGQDASRAVGREFGPEASEPESRGATR